MAQKRTPRILTCSECPNTFRPLSPSHITCGPDCKLARHRRLRREREQAEREQVGELRPRRYTARLCRACGKPLPPAYWLYHRECRPEVTTYGPSDYGTGVLA